MKLILSMKYVEKLDKNPPKAKQHTTYLKAYNMSYEYKLFTDKLFPVFKIMQIQWPTSFS